MRLGSRIAALLVVVGCSIGLYMGLSGKTQARLQRAGTAQYGPARHAQVRVAIYDNVKHTFSKPMTRLEAETEMRSGLHPNGWIVGRLEEPEIDATDILVVWDKPINPIKIVEPHGAIIEGKIIGD